MRDSGRISQANVGGVNIANTGAAGDIMVSVGDERYWTEAFPLDPPQNPRGLLPSQLLAARHQVMPFDHRRDELLDQQMAGWRDKVGGLRVLLIHGAGGQGKTRLATEFASRSYRAGWTVARARHVTDPKPAASPVRDPEPGSGLLMVVDYAERWPLEDLLALFERHLIPGAIPVRVVLLARPTQFWWPTLRYILSQLDAETDDFALTDLAGDLDDRQAVFIGARERFAEILDVTDSAAIPPPDRLDAPEFGLALTLHMAALVAVDAHVNRLATPIGPTHLSTYLLDREAAHWARMYANRRLTVRPQAMTRTVVAATHWSIDLSRG